MNAGDAELLRAARAKAEKLLSQLVEHQASLDANPPKISAENLALGREALQNAIASARRTLQALSDAERIGSEEDEDDDIGRFN